eukprot:137224-Pelagomonas_calceolata.AAC.11
MESWSLLQTRPRVWSFKSLGPRLRREALSLSMGVRVQRQTAHQACALIQGQRGIRSHTCTGRTGTPSWKFLTKMPLTAWRPRARPKVMLLLLEHPHGASYNFNTPPTNTGRASGPGDIMVPRSRDPMQEQVPPNLLPFAPPRSPYLMDPVGEVVDYWSSWQVGGLFEVCANKNYAGN